MSTIFYVRVSTEDQETARQMKMAEEIKADKVFEEKASGKNMDRPEFRKMMAYLREGDTLIVESISRLSRNVRDLLSTVEKLQEKGVQFRSLKENIDTTTPTGRFILTVFAALSELEREQTLQRQKEGIAIAKAKGKYRGRKRQQVDSEQFTKLYNKWKQREITGREFGRIIKMTPNTLYRRIRLYEALGEIN